MQVSGKFDVTLVFAEVGTTVRVRRMLRVKTRNEGGVVCVYVVWERGGCAGACVRAEGSKPNSSFPVPVIPVHVHVHVHLPVHAHVHEPHVNV